MANITTTTAAADIGETWIPQIIGAAEFEKVIEPNCFNDWQSKYKNGDVVHVPRGGNLTAQTKSAGAAWVPEALTDTEQTLTINTWQVAGFEIEDPVEALSSVDVRSFYTKKVGYALARGSEVALAALPQSFSQSVGTFGSELTIGDCRQARGLLALGGNMRDHKVCWILSTGAYTGLLGQDEFINQMYTGETDAPALQTAMVAKLFNWPVYESNLTRAASAGQSDSFVFRREAMAIVYARKPRPLQEEIAKDIATVVGAHQLYGVAEVDRYAEAAANVTAGDDWAVLLKTLQ